MILSVDGGATKTCAIIYDEKSHKFMASGISAASNFMSVSEQVSLENIQIAVDSALQDADVATSELNYIVLGLAGIGDSSRSTETGNNIVSKIFGSGKYRLENDGFVAYRMSNLFDDGVMFAPGTGSVGYYQKDRVIQRVGGWGWFAGDEGSASWISKTAITYAERQSDGILPGSSMVELVEQYFGDNFRNVIGSIEKNRDKRKIAMMAPYVTKLAMAGDHAAISIIQEAAKYTGSILNSMLGQFQSCPAVSVVGGTTLSGKLLQDNIQSSVKCNVRFFPGFHVCIGGIVLASMDMGFSFTGAERDQAINYLQESVMKKNPSILRDSLGIIVQ